MNDDPTPLTACPDCDCYAERRCYCAKGCDRHEGKS